MEYIFSQLFWWEYLLIGIVSFFIVFLIFLLLIVARKHKNFWYSKIPLIENKNLIPKFNITKRMSKNKWGISNRNLEKYWYRSLVKKYKICVFKISEFFDKGLFSSKFLNVKLLVHSLSDLSTANRVLNHVNYLSAYFESLWYTKYRVQLINFKKYVAKTNNIPVYYFYKYYFTFLEDFRLLIIGQLINFIIPNIIFLWLPNKTLEEHNFAVPITSPEKIIEDQIKNTEVAAEELYDNVFNLYMNDIKTSTNKFKNINNDLIITSTKYLNPSLVISTMYAKHKYKVNLKILNLPLTFNLHQIFSKYNKIRKSFKDNQKNELLKYNNAINYIISYLDLTKEEINYFIN
ncbi:hypothetical protein [Spiroplasma endosymbiont of Labia minor]|uniref:hypothetical protein n=1 Tax=Spiroplasma endosymbiont of Labia minor TaxID=3066305 RepID=UPI0030CE38C1